MIKVKWEKSNLKKGEKIKIQENLLVTNDGNRFEKAVYIGETEYGIMLRLFFEPGALTEDEIWNYRMFIDWPAIYCGTVKLQTADGKPIKANRLFR